MSNGGLNQTLLEHYCSALVVRTGQILSVAGWLSALAFYVAALLLASSGVAKIRQPSPTRVVLEDVGILVPAAAVRILGLLEAVVGVVNLVSPTLASVVALATMYGAFALYLSYVLVRRLPATSCGCAGTREVPPSWLHVVLNVTAIATAISTLLGRSEGLVRDTASLGLPGLVFALAVFVAALLSFHVVAYLPELFASVNTDDSGGEAASAISSHAERRAAP